MLHIIKTVQQFDEGGFARAGVADKTDAFARFDAQGEVIEQRRVLPTVLKGDAVKDDFAAGYLQRAGIGAVGHAQGLGVYFNHLFHFVGAALKIGDVLADIAEIAVDDEVAGEDERDVARRRAAAPPEQYSVERDGGSQEPKDDELKRSAICAECPVAAGASLPFLKNAREAAVFAGFGSEGFDDGVAGDGVSDGSAGAGDSKAGRSDGVGFSAPGSHRA